MTHIEQAIKEAVEKGGYGEKPSAVISRNKKTIAWYVQSGVLLDPSFWQALGKARGWFTKRLQCGGYEGELKDIIQPPKCSFCQWHRFIDYLIGGKDAESFFATLLE